MNIPLVNLKAQFRPLRAEMLASLERILDSQHVKEERIVVCGRRDVEWEAGQELPEISSLRESREHRIERRVRA